MVEERRIDPLVQDLDIIMTDIIFNGVEQLPYGIFLSFHNLEEIAITVNKTTGYAHRCVVEPCGLAYVLHRWTTDSCPGL